MQPVAMALMLLSLLAAFLYTANKRWQLLRIGRDVSLFDQVGERVRGVMTFAFGQKRMGQYPWAGLAHKVIFAGFVILLLRSLILWGRGFDPEFSLFVLGPDQTPGIAYEFIKDVVAILVVLGALYFVYLRVIKHEARLTESGEALLILGIIIVMMLSDMAYDGAAQVLFARHWAEVCGGGAPDLCESVTTVATHIGDKPLEAQAVGFSVFPTPGGSFFATLFRGLDPDTLVTVGHAGFWTHATLVMVFLNLLPLSKHFHVITSFPNVYFRRLTPAGKLSYMGDSEQIGEKVMAAYEAAESGEPVEEPVGLNRVGDLSWKAILDFYTCTECGRCSDHCPAHRTGKILSPKQMTIDLRDHLYENQEKLIAAAGGAGLATTEDPISKGVEQGMSDEGSDEGDDSDASDTGDEDDPNGSASPLDAPLIGSIIHPDVLWACTTCRACEEQCPVLISYVDKIVDMRRNLVLIQGELPPEAGKAIQDIQTNGNPWNMSPMDRAGWAEGLDIPLMSDKPDADYLYWVGCAASYDDRSKKIARATAQLLKAAGVDFAILGEEETCTGDPARRAGDEHTFAMQAEANAGTLNGYSEQGGIKKIITTCPHCFNTLANEYPDFGAKFEVIHHTAFLDQLVREGKLEPKDELKEPVVFHDSCYLGRYNGVYEQPREIIKSVGAELREVQGASREKGLCCGAGGMQMFMEEQNKDRMNNRRALQLIDTGAKTIASACPFCTVMVSDGLKAQSREEEIRNVDVAELLAESCGLGNAPGEEEAEEAAE